MGTNDETRDMFHDMARSLVESQKGRLRDALGVAVDDINIPTRMALHDVARNCGPDTIDVLVQLFNQLRTEGRCERCNYSNGTHWRYCQEGRNRRS